MYYLKMTSIHKYRCKNLLQLNSTSRNYFKNTTYKSKKNYCLYFNNTLKITINLRMKKNFSTLNMLIIGVFLSLLYFSAEASNDTFIRYNSL